MLILAPQKLVVLEVPKTGSLALRTMLKPHVSAGPMPAARHIGVNGYRRNHAFALDLAYGGRVETLAVVREPLRRLQSWYRYRMRHNVAHLPISTRGMGFEAFVLAYLAHPAPAFARVGRQDRFIGWKDARARVDHVFDYMRLDRLERFLSRRLAQKLVLPVRNASPQDEALDYSLSEAVLTRLLQANAAEFAMYRAVRGAGHLRRSDGRSNPSNSAH
ncbi:gamma-glutamyl kinase [Pseudorhodobacter sp.]|uniref:gamma-glutamyl kinase n=1 Tax=Pseudorhodobacter sp. TaxID=1934400 RepID=UPI002648D0A3|nr:gamma-glutamyl kinase [Pseudorhodobacter sp.]MDN5786288.1 gamma-glutamyl kinase [Pseudorhodobacter sp.]